MAANMPRSGHDRIDVDGFGSGLGILNIVYDSLITYLRNDRMLINASLFFKGLWPTYEHSLLDLNAQRQLSLNSIGVEHLNLEENVRM